MIKPVSKKRVDEVVSIWLRSSIEAHSFIAEAFWRGKAEDMRSVYLPLAETYIYEEHGTILGFVSLVENTLAAVFVCPEAQGRGVGTQLVQYSKSLRARLVLSVYKRNVAARDFYSKRGFTPLREQIDEQTGEAETVMEWCTESRT